MDGGYLAGGADKPSDADLWLIETDSIGNVQDELKLGGSVGDWAYRIKPTIDGGYIIVGVTKSYDPGAEDVWLIKIRNPTSVSERNDISIHPWFRVYPNPFTFYTFIEYAISNEADVSLRIYDITGKLIAEIVNGMQEPGSYAVKWDGKNSASKRVKPGVYFVKLISKRVKEVRKLSLVK